jgi:hypothetical protein
MTPDFDAPDETGINPSVASVRCDQVLFTRAGTQPADDLGEDTLAIAAETGFYEVRCREFGTQEVLSRATIDVRRSRFKEPARARKGVSFRIFPACRRREAM